MAYPFAGAIVLWTGKAPCTGNSSELFPLSMLLGLISPARQQGALTSSPFGYPVLPKSTRTVTSLFFNTRTRCIEFGLILPILSFRQFLEELGPHRFDERCLYAGELG